MKKEMIPIFSNTLGDEELQAVKRVFDSKWLGKGKECDTFEKNLREHFRAENVLLCNCCTSAIYISLRALGVGKGDEVIISTGNFVGAANAVMELGAKPVFADIDTEYFNILPSEIERLKTPKTKAVFILHYGGHPARIDEIKAACGNIPFVEDSANAISSTYHGKACGTFGAAGVFSFDAMKTLVMGDGGALIINDPAILEKAKSMRYLGLAPGTPSGMFAASKGSSRWWEFQVDHASGRYISNDILAAIGNVQFAKLPSFIKRRREVWTAYQNNLNNIPGLTLPPEPLPDTTGSYYLYWIKTEKDRDGLAQHLQDQGVYTTYRYFPLHKVKHYGSDQKLPNSEHINEIALNLPVHQNLSNDDVDRIISAVKSYFK